MDHDTRQALDSRLRRIAGQVNGVHRMVDEDRYCIDVLTQIAAVRAALGKVSAMMLESHLKTCVAGAFDSKDPEDRNAKVQELITIFDKSVRS